MIYDRIGALCAAPSIIAGAGTFVGPRTGAEIAHDDIVAAHAEFVVLQRNAAAAGRGLSGNGNIVRADDISRQFNRSADIKYDNAIRLADGIAERARARIVQMYCCSRIA